MLFLKNKRLGDPDPEVRRDAIWKDFPHEWDDAGRLDDESIREIIFCLADKDKDVRDEAVLALSELEFDDFIDEMYVFFEDKNPEVRLSALKVLSNFSEKLDDRHALKLTDLLYSVETLPEAAEVITEIALNLSGRAKIMLAEYLWGCSPEIHHFLRDFLTSIGEEDLINSYSPTMYKY